MAVIVKNGGGNIEVTAVEYNEDIAAVYKDFYPGDMVIVGDAHEYLLKHYMEFDYIFSSPPCPTHSDMRRCAVHKGQNEALYPDMKLYEEIILLQNFAPKDCKWVIENVKPYYTPLIRPTIEIHRHLFWSNGKISNTIIESDVQLEKVHDNSTVFGINLKKYDMPSVKYKKQVLRNMINPVLGKHIFDCLFETEIKVQGLFEF